MSDEPKCPHCLHNLSRDEILTISQTPDSKRYLLAYRLRMDGSVFKDIGEVLGCSGSRARGLFQKGRKLINESNKTRELAEKALVVIERTAGVTQDDLAVTDWAKKLAEDCLGGEDN